MEICEVKYRHREPPRRLWRPPWEEESRIYYFEVEAVGPNGRYIARESYEFSATHMGSELAGPALDSLLERLTKDGWQPLPRGQFWWSYRFRRPTRMVQ